jgi:WD40 repeat protein
MRKRLLLVISCLPFARIACAQAEEPWRLYRTLVGHAHKICKLAFNSDDSKLVSNDAHGKIITWDVENRTIFNKFMCENRGGGSTSIASNTDATLIALGHISGVLTIFDPLNGRDSYCGKELRRVVNLGGDFRKSVCVTAVKFSEDNLYFSVALEDGQFFRFPVDQFKSRIRFLGKEISDHYALRYDMRSIENPADNPFCRPAISDNGSYMFKDNTIIDRYNGNNFQLPDDTANVHDLGAFSNDGNLLAVGCTDNAIRIWTQTDSIASCQD